MLLFACSTNRGKLADFAFAAKEARNGIEIRAMPDIELIEAPEETGATFEENAALKAVYYSQFTPEAVITDDSGLAVDALNGAPGIYSARYAGPGATDRANIDLLLRRLAAGSNRHAHFVCALAMAQGGKILLTGTGTVEGEILREPRGENGFGYDPVFFYPPLDCSFAQLTEDAKFSVSHRGNALRSLFAKFENRHCL